MLHKPLKNGSQIKRKWILEGLGFERSAITWSFVRKTDPFIILELTRWGRLLATVEQCCNRSYQVAAFCFWTTLNQSYCRLLCACPRRPKTSGLLDGKLDATHSVAKLVQIWACVSASTLLKIPVEGVIPTTNHLESFNRLLKWKHLATWLCSGHRLCFDFLINILIIRILPEVYGHRKAQQQYKQWLGSQFKDQAGGTNLAEIHATLVKERLEQQNSPICWWDEDFEQDTSAQHLVNFRQLVVSQKGPGIYQATCNSTAPVNAIHLGLPTFYTLELHQSRSGSICSCPDFCTWGGACKHLWALQLIVESWVKQGHEKPFHYPKTCDEATLLRSNIPIPKHQPAIQPLQPTPAAPVLWDSAFIQSLGQDSTTFDDQETVDTATDNSDSNSDSSLDADHAVNPIQQNQHIPLLAPVQHH